MPHDSPSIYDFPQYLDLLFADETDREVAFAEGAFRRYASRPVRQLLEPGCGGGRLVRAFARRGYRVTGFDSSRPALAFLQRQLARSRLSANVFAGDLSTFRLRQPVDAAICTFNTFRHLLTEAAAVRHLRAVARALRRGGIYILGLHLLPLDVDLDCIERWTARRGPTQVTVTLRILSANRRRRLEQVRLSLLVRRRNSQWRLRTEFPLRMYTARQFRTLLHRVPALELCDVFDFWYDLDDPLALNDDITDTVAVLRKR